MDLVRGASGSGWSTGASRSVALALRRIRHGARTRRTCTAGRRATLADGMARAKKPDGARTIRDVFGPASQPEMYLERALSEFHRSGNPSDLGVRALVERIANDCASLVAKRSA
jgi:hypothetical protein